MATNGARTTEQAQGEEAKKKKKRKKKKKKDRERKGRQSVSVCVCVCLRACVCLRVFVYGSTDLWDWVLCSLWRILSVHINHLTTLCRPFFPHASVALALRGSQVPADISNTRNKSRQACTQRKEGRKEGKGGREGG